MKHQLASYKITHFGIEFFLKKTLTRQWQRVEVCIFCHTGTKLVDVLTRTVAVSKVMRQIFCNFEALFCLNICLALHKSFWLPETLEKTARHFSILELFFKHAKKLTNSKIGQSQRKDVIIADCSQLLF